MSVTPFQLERYFAQHEFKARYLLSASDIESLSLAELLGMASPASLALWQELKLGYTESPGHPRLREEIVGLYAGLSAGDVLVSAPEEAIFVLMHTLLQPGDHVITTAPAYQSLHEVARSIGCLVTPWQLQAGRGGWFADLQRLEKSLTEKTRLVVLNFPHNPTGHLLEREELEAVVALARRRGLYLFSDEMYRLLELQPGARLPPVCELYEKGITLSGLSKSFALPGLRIGWLAAQDRALLEACLTFKDYTTICSSAPGEILAIFALQNKERILQRSREILQVNLALAAEFFADFEQVFEWLPPKGGSIAFPRWRGAGTVETFCQQVLEGKDVLVTPGSLFGGPSDHFRIGLGRWNFGEALEQVRAYLTERRL